MGYDGEEERQRGIKFEEKITRMINSRNYSKFTPKKLAKHLFVGNPVDHLISYLLQKENLNLKNITGIKAYWLGGKATSGEGDELFDYQGNLVEKSKSDIIIEFIISGNKRILKGISVKSCRVKKPTNAQLFCTGARAFTDLLSNNKINVSEEAVKCLRMFCGDAGCSPQDLLSPTELQKRKSLPRNHERYFWEELPDPGRSSLEAIFTSEQDKITQLILQKAYKDDPFPPEYIFHQTKKYQDINEIEMAIYTMEEFVSFSRYYKGFHFYKRKVTKGRFKGDPGEHLYPRFGFIQFQRFGNKLNATELQFNLKAGYFYDIDKM
ncbi:MAG: hypothetical protein ACFFCS_11080 [Candidatus Hodarchaeota archaeon]